MEKTIRMRDIMTTKVVCVSPDTPLTEASRIISDHNFDGVPVVDAENHLVGILTEYDLLTKTSTLNTSFLEKIVNDVYGDKSTTDSPEEISLINMKVRDLMNTDPLCLRDDATFEEAIGVFIAHHKVNPIPIVDTEHKLVGVVSRFDVLRPMNLLGYHHPPKK